MKDENNEKRMFLQMINYNFLLSEDKNQISIGRGSKIFFSRQ